MSKQERVRKVAGYQISGTHTRGRATTTDRYLPTLPSVFGRGGKELAARYLDVEAGVSEEGGRLPGIGDAHEGQSDGDKAAISGGGAVAGSAVEGADESTEKRAMSATQKRTQRKYKAMARARGEVWEEG